MNILIPHNWLKDHLDTQADPATIQQQLSLCGPAVERIYQRGGDAVYDIEVTTNRVDSMSVRGIAREAAVILDNAGFPSQLKTLHVQSYSVNGEPLPLPEIDNASQLCRRITTVVLDGVQHQPTPTEMATRLQQVDLNPKDSVVDITNYVSHELGHPCHAFDYDKIMSLGGVIRVREAKAGQPFMTLDGASYEAVGGEVVFVNDDDVIIDLPGIMGTANTAVDDSTQRVLFWVESIDPDRIRFASMTHAIRTPSAQLNERHLDHSLAADVLRRGIGLYQQITGARVASEIYDEVTEPAQEREVFLPKHELFRYLGIELSEDDVTSILTQLGCAVSSQSDHWQVTIPTYRTDIRIPADLVEEIARIYGYHNLPSQLMDTPIPLHEPTDTNFRMERRIRQALADWGYQELYTYSLVGEELLAATNQSADDHLRLKNPLTSDMEYLRRHIIPSHLHAAQIDQILDTGVWGTYELANVYVPQEGSELPEEQLVLAVVDTDLRRLRSTLDFLAERSFLPRHEVKKYEENAKIHDHSNTFYINHAIITLNDRVLGFIGYLPDGKVGMELLWKEWLAAANRWPKYQPIPKTAPYFEDWTIQIPAGAGVGEVVAHLQNASPFITHVTLIDQFEDNWTFRLRFLDRDEQFTAERAREIQAKVTPLGL